MPRILVSGRGGSGKSTIVSLVARNVGETGRVLVVDTDESNLGLPSMLGIAPPNQSVMDFLGGKPAVGKQLIEALKTGGSESVRLFDEALTIATLPPEIVSTRNGVSLVRIGKIEHSHEGCACPMGAVSRAFLNHLALSDSEWALVDTEAGIEHFGRGVIEAVDGVVLVVDPSNEAVRLSEKAAKLCEEAGKPFIVVVNKVDAETEAALRAMLSAKGLEVTSAIPYSGDVVKANLVGQEVVANALQPQITYILDMATRGFSRSNAAG